MVFCVFFLRSAFIAVRIRALMLYASQPRRRPDPDICYIYRSAAADRSAGGARFIHGTRELLEPGAIDMVVEALPIGAALPRFDHPPTGLG